MQAAIVLFTRDLRIHDHPALAAAAREAQVVVPVFVLDPALLGQAPPVRTRFLVESLDDLTSSLRRLGTSLVVRHGDPVREVLRVATGVGAEAVFASEDVSRYARRREQRLRQALAKQRIDLRLFAGVTAVPLGALHPVGSDGPFRVFTPFWRRWRHSVRPSVATPAALRPLPALDAGAVPRSLRSRVLRASSAGRFPGGETDARMRLDAWVSDGLDEYETRRDDLADPGTSLLSAYLRFGCISATEVVERVLDKPGGEAFARQLCWRDFHHQLLAHDPSLARRDLRPRGDSWRVDPDTLAAWREGRTGYPVVDAGMRQLASEGFMPNRARMVVASFLTKHLRVDWRIGAAHFSQHLVDGDVANNTGNWQWVAGTGADTRPNRVLSPVRQAKRFDPDGVYVRRWVPELEPLETGAIHEPWRLGARRPRGYPAPLVDHDEAVRRFRRARGLDG